MIWLLETLKIQIEEQLLITYYVKKHLILQKIQDIQKLVPIAVDLIKRSDILKSHIAGKGKIKMVRSKLLKIKYLIILT